MSVGDLSQDDQRSLRTPEWPGLPRAGGGSIPSGFAPMPFQQAIADGALEPLEGKTDREHALDEAWESGYRCASEVLRCERREAREAADERRGRRALIFQVALLSTIAVVVLCSTYLLTH